MRIECEIKGNDEIGYRNLPNMNWERHNIQCARERERGEEKVERQQQTSRR